MTTSEKIYQWNTFPTLKINHIECNYDNSLLIFATNHGYRIYSTESHTCLSKVDDVQDAIGPLVKASVFYNSYLICFLGESSNTIYTRNQLILWDELNQKNLGIIILKENIITFYLTKHIIFITIKDSILLFELNTLAFISKISNALTQSNFDMIISLVDSNPISLAYIPLGYGSKNIVLIERYKINNDNGKVEGKYKIGLISHFEVVSQICFTSKENDMYLLCTSRFENKIHIYTIEDNALIYCIYLGKQKMSLGSFIWDVKMKFFGFLIDNEELYIYKVKGKNVHEYVICKCEEHNDKEVKQRRKSSNNSFLGGYFQRMFSDENPAFAHIKLNGIQGMAQLLLFDNTEKNKILYISGIDGSIQYIVINRKNGSDIKILKNKVELFSPI
jgi:hypothetical protein